MKIKPNFLVIGAPKAATSTLCSHLSLHPEIYLFPPKETHFFTTRYDRGIEWYLSLFRPKAGEKAIGEGTPAYTCTEQYPEVPQRIATHLPDARLIYIVRDPFERMESHFVQTLDNGEKWANFSQALKESKEIIDGSKYFKQLSEYRKYYSDEQIHIIFTSDFEKDLPLALSDCYKFLDVNTNFRQESIGIGNVNSRSTKGTDGRLLGFLRKKRFFADIHSKIPRSIIDTLRPLLRKPLQASAEWTPELRAWAKDQLATDSKAFLRYCGKPEDFWEKDNLKVVSK